MERLKLREDSKLFLSLTFGTFRCVYWIRVYSDFESKTYVTKWTDFLEPQRGFPHQPHTCCFSIFFCFVKSSACLSKVPLAVPWNSMTGWGPNGASAFSSRDSFDYACDMTFTRYTVRDEKHWLTAESVSFWSIWFIWRTSKCWKNYAAAFLNNLRRERRFMNTRNFLTLIERYRTVVMKRILSVRPC